MNKKGITKTKIIQKIREDESLWKIYSSKYINYSKLINDCFKNKPNAKPKRNYNLKFWLPNKLYDYIKWLDKWVENWHTNRNACDGLYTTVGSNITTYSSTESKQVQPGTNTTITTVFIHPL